MRNLFLEDALKRVPNPHILVNLVSRRVRQLNGGHPPLTVVNGVSSPTDIALKEVAEGKLTVEVIEVEEEKEKKKK